MTKLSELDRERLYNEIKLEKGNHPAGNAACLMEMTALLAGEKHTDRPRCACPVITSFAMRLNDGLPDDLRQMLKPYAPAFINTRDGHEKERREYLALRAVNVFVPFWLRLTSKPELIAHAERCEGARTLTEARKVVVEVRAAAYAAAYAAAAAAAYAADAAAYAADAAAAYAADAAYAAAAAAYAYRQKHLPALMPAILETLDGLLLIGAKDRIVRQKGVVVLENAA